MRALRYPQGWLSPSGMTDHNNYDVVELFYRGWPHMEPLQRKAASDATEEMLDWCLKNSVMENGELTSPDQGDPIPDSYYFAAAFLETIGFFDRRRQFWTEKTLPDARATAIKSGVIAKLKTFNPYYTVVDDALARLGARLHPWTSAVL